MMDINGQRIEKGGMALLLVQVLEVQETDPSHVRVRVANSDMELAVGARPDEAMGGIIADSELTAWVEAPVQPQRTLVSAFE